MIASQGAVALAGQLRLARAEAVRLPRPVQWVADASALSTVATVGGKVEA